MDPQKTTAGACGCGVADADLDLDGVPDCADFCVDTALGARSLDTPHCACPTAICQEQAELSARAASPASSRGSLERT
jgi:hypothetical protein